MTHKRQRIREAVVAILEAIPEWQGRVFPNRTRPTEAAELPVALVYSLNEDTDVVTMGGTLQRSLTLSIEIRASASGAIDNVLDDLAQKAEKAIAADPRLGRRAIHSRLSGTTLGLDGEGESRQAVLTLTYIIQYQTDGAGN